MTAETLIGLVCHFRTAEVQLSSSETRGICGREHSDIGPPFQLRLRAPSPTNSSVAFWPPTSAGGLSIVHGSRIFGGAHRSRLSPPSSSVFQVPRPCILWCRGRRAESSYRHYSSCFRARRPEGS